MTSSSEEHAGGEEEDQTNGQLPSKAYTSAVCAMQGAHQQQMLAHRRG
jgi:hypothetical protein